MKTRLLFLTLAFSFSAAHAATVAVTQGQLTLDYTNSAALFLSNPNHFVQSYSNTLTATQIQNSATTGSVLSETGIQFLVNTGSLSNPAGRALQGTTMTYDPSNITSTVTGQTGFGGVTRWDYAFGGGFLMGDYTLEYNALRAGVAKSGWYLENHYGFGMIAWDLANVITTTDGNNFTLSGDLFTAPEFAGAFGLTSGADFGNFSFTTAPEPSRALLAIAGFTGVFIRRRRSGALKA